MAENESDQILHVEPRGDVTIVNFNRSRITSEMIFDFSDEIDNNIRLDSGAKLVVNMANLEWINSSVIGKFIGLLKRSRQSDAHLRLCCVAPEIREIFRITNLDTCFDIDATEEEALQIILNA